MAFKYDSNARYAKTHEWARIEGDLVVVGISDYAQDALSDVVFVELPAVGSTVSAGTAVAVVESVKAAEDVYSPVSGEVVAVNEKLADKPELVNADPYGEAWFFKVRPSNLSELDGLMDAAAYEAFLASQEH
ncbi:MAG: glycine cleavage system protein GcvH [Anaerolineae bacterium]|nr:glycine cleavage system protein GcvH [Caldilineales bacterium]MCX7851455.1 glycine cleavage system protein GcvH [Caldilineales bacterium]MDW8269842.1 glycine cleavage system protein GcvH [Anaerolineae bacterium]